MNKNRKKEIIKCCNSIELLINNLKSLKDDEEFSYDMIPENLQYSMRAEYSDECIELLDENIDLLEEAIENIRGI